MDVFRAKVESKADNTMGVFVSISGFSSVAARDASGRKTPCCFWITDTYTGCLGESQVSKTLSNGCDDTHRKTGGVPTSLQTSSKESTNSSTVTVGL